MTPPALLNTPSCLNKVFSQNKFFFSGPRNVFQLTSFYLFSFLEFFEIFDTVVASFLKRVF